jgi:lipopolysaccharide transport system permease protein
VTSAQENELALRTQVVDAARPRRLPNYREAWQYRFVIRALVVRDLRLRYRQTLLGATWVLAGPLIAAGVFTLVFGKIARLPHPGTSSYFSFALAGMAAWTAFSGALIRVASSLIQNGGIVGKVFVPRILLPLASWMSSLVDATVVLVALVLVTVAVGDASPRLLVAPVAVVAASLLGLAAGLLIAGLVVMYRDVNYVLPFAVQLFLFIAPVAYGRTALPVAWRRFYYVNPLASLIDLVRWTTGGSGVPLLALAWSAGIGLVLLAIGATQFERHNRYLADVI